MELRGAYREFGVCDYAAISEAFSDSVCRLLSTNGGGLSELAVLVAEDEAFEHFLLKHIDETTPPGQLSEIEQNAKNKCPESARRVCARVLAAAGELRRKTQRR
jgi:hypothetical protein